MIKKVISLILVICFINSLVLTIFADGKSQTRKYFNLEIKQPYGSGVEYHPDADFMILTENNKSMVYIKAEDFAKLTTPGGHPYKYNQTYTECAYVSAETGHVVRFLFDSTDVSVFYACNDIVYTAPYKALYEDGVAWIPFDFALLLFGMEPLATDTELYIYLSKYTPLSVINLIHKNIKSYSFDPILELDVSELQYGRDTANTIVICNKLLSFELTEWAAVLLRYVGISELYDAEFVETISRSFVVPSTTETELMDTFALEKFAAFGKAHEGLMRKGILTGDWAVDSQNALDSINKMIEEYPGLSKRKIVKYIQKATKSDDMKETFDIVFEKFTGFYNETGSHITAGAGLAFEVLNICEYLNIYWSKSNRSLSALKQYAEECKYDEKHIINANCLAIENPILGYLVDKIVRDGSSVLNNGFNAVIGHAGALASALGFAWDFASQAGPIKGSVDSAKCKVVSDYAIKYQSDCLGLYYKHYSNCLIPGNTTEESLEKLLNSLYSYMKFSYIARNSAAESYLEIQKSMGDNADWKANADKAAKLLNENNVPIAELLTYMEQEIFTPSDANEYATTADDSDFINTLNNAGTPIEAPTQNTVPAFEFPDFPGALPLDYISEDEAIELAKRTVTKLSGGMLESDLISSMLFEMTGTTELFTYVSLGGYVVDGNPEAYVVDVRSDDISQMLLFVSVIGNEVWLGTPSDSSPGGYYVYKELDLLHADRGDYMSAIGDLTFALFDAYQ